MTPAILGTIRSEVLLDPVKKENGQFELEVPIDPVLFQTVASKKDYAQKLIAIHLAGCVRSTGIGPGQGVWKFHVDPYFLPLFDGKKELTL